MHSKLMIRLHSYICEHNPELILQLEEDFSLRNYLEEKVAAVQGLIENGLQEGKSAQNIQELCLDAMTADLKPSVFIYLRNLIRDQFHGDFLMMRENGTLTQETIYILNISKPLFESFEFSEKNENDPHLRLTVISLIDEYLRKN